jgi:TonB-dependent SusC/RagA subfamily outer membrane receptor
LFVSAACATSGVRGATAAAGREAREARCAEDSVRVGYGAQRRCEMTSAVGSVAFDARSAQTAGTLAEALRARVPGLEVTMGRNGVLSLRVRGSPSGMGGGEPLLVLDGMPVDAGIGGALATIEPRDVARVDVLKDAGAAAVYGSRAANGVVVITTRRR